MVSYQILTDLLIEESPKTSDVNVVLVLLRKVLGNVELDEVIGD